MILSKLIFSLKSVHVMIFFFRKEMKVMAAIFQKCIGKSRLQIPFHGTLRTKTSFAESTLEKIKMSEHVELWKRESVCESLPLVLIFPWLTATPSSVQKYANLYHQRGMDVLVVRGAFKHFLWPPYGFKLGFELEKCLKEIPSYQKFIIHCFSIGAYNYTLTQMNMRSGVPCFPSENVIAQIFDSIVIGSTDNMAEGLAISMTNNRFLQRSIKKLALSYIQLTRRNTQDIYDKSIQFCKDNFLPVPSLFFYCENDVMCNINSMKEFLALQKEKHGDKIWEKSWPVSAHAGHLRVHQEDYLSSWNSFVDTLDL